MTSFAVEKRLRSLPKEWRKRPADEAWRRPMRGACHVPKGKEKELRFFFSSRKMNLILLFICYRSHSILEVLEQFDTLPNNRHLLYIHQGSLCRLPSSHQKLYIEQKVLRFDILRAPTTYVVVWPHKSESAQYLQHQAEVGQHWKHWMNQISQRSCEDHSIVRGNL